MGEMSTEKENASALICIWPAKTNANRHAHRRRCRRHRLRRHRLRRHRTPYCLPTFSSQDNKKKERSEILATSGGEHRLQQCL